jgi:hypothetical protein
MANDCALYSQSLEDLDHLILSCPFSREVWFKVFHRCGLQWFAPLLSHAFAVWWFTARKWVPRSRHKVVDSLIIMVS